MPQRYFLDKAHKLSDQDLHHIRHVMRMKSGDHIIVCDEASCHLVELSIHDDITYEIISDISQTPATYIHILQGLPKGQKSEQIIKTASYFGADQVMFVPFQRSIAKLDNLDHKSKRYTLIAKEAAELAHRNHLLNIGFSKRIEDVDYQSYDLILLADEAEKQTPIWQALKGIQPDTRILCIIGPEGGLTDGERNFFKGQKAISVHLGQHILPTEYAHIHMLIAIGLKIDR